MKRTLKSILAATAITASPLLYGTHVDLDNEGAFPKDPPIRVVSGNVVKVDEESIPASFSYKGKDGFNKGFAHFQYEIIRVKEGDKVLQILAPQPTEYAIGDHFSENVKFYKALSFDLLVRSFSSDECGRALQIGDVRMDGVMIYKDIGH